MKAVVQRVSHAHVDIDGVTVGAIEKGFLVLLGVTHEDTEAQAVKLADKLTGLRIFEDENGKMNRSLEDEVEKDLLKNAVSRLSPRERKIVELRYGLKRQDGAEMTQKEVADRLGISQSYISRLEKRIILRLRREITRQIF